MFGQSIQCSDGEASPVSVFPISCSSKRVGNALFRKDLRNSVSDCLVACMESLTEEREPRITGFLGRTWLTRSDSVSGRSRTGSAADTRGLVFAVGYDVGRDFDCKDPDIFGVVRADARYPVRFGPGIGQTACAAGAHSR